jgi:hypothetical protein
MMVGLLKSTMLMVKRRGGGRRVGRGETLRGKILAANSVGPLYKHFGRALQAGTPQAGTIRAG